MGTLGSSKRRSKAGAIFMVKVIVDVIEGGDESPFCMMEAMRLCGRPVKTKEFISRTASMLGENISEAYLRRKARRKR